jgi:putative hydroxymethylpyrimidine transport system permease protein
MTGVLRPLVILIGLCAAWYAVVAIASLPHFILPDPLRVARVLVDRLDFLLLNAAITLAEILIGLALGTLLGCASALLLAHFRPARRWLLPILVISQAIPVFAVAPLLVIWFGYGIGSKVAAASMIIFFPITSAFFDGLRRTERDWVDLARMMGASRWSILVHLRVPAALPSLASGLRVAVVVAPIGAVIGEWVGASAGLGYLMTQQLARGQTPLAFAALVLLCLLGLALYYTTDWLGRRLVPWQPSQGD